MKSFFVLIFCLVFLPTIIHGSDSDSDGSENESDGDYIVTLKDKINEMAENGEKINGILGLERDGYINEGGYRLFYKGVRMPDSKPVAIKFYEHCYEGRAQCEYEMYTYLNAIDNEDVERFGIPVIYYYGRWIDWGYPYIVMAFTSFEASVCTKADKGELEKPLNSLIVFRQFVRQSKYLHSRGVRHDNINTDNIYIRNYQCFLHIFFESSKMKEDRNYCIIPFKPRRCHRNEIRFAIDDWENFFYAMCHISEVPLEWFLDDMNNHLWVVDGDHKVREAKKNIKDILKKLKSIASAPLRNVFKAFYYEIFGKKVLQPRKEFPDYDAIDQIITAQIAKLVPPGKPAFFTWMNESDTKAALEHMENHRVPDNNSDIEEPSEVDYATLRYRNVDFKYFDKKFIFNSSN